jgi:glyoxylase-like metal-dependent hydrolase (beta-lactamase superfamily II)/quinol monooxygenase YgiN
MIELLSNVYQCMKFDHLLASYFSPIITKNPILTYQLVSHYHALHFCIFITGVSFNNIVPAYYRIDETEQKQKLMLPTKLKFQRNQVLILLAVVASTMLVTSVINSIDMIPQQQYVFAQEKINVSSYNKTSTNATFPQIHNYTSSPPGPVNSWIVESANGVLIIDAQRTLSEAENALDVIKKINKPILGVIITHPHPDHIGGTAVLLNGTSNVPIYSTKLTFDIMKNDTGGLIALTKKLHGNDYPDQVVLPNRIIKSDEIITIDGITYNLQDIGRGEGGDMTLIYLPLQKLLFTGDVVNNRIHAALIEGHSSEWIKQIEYIKQNYSDAKVLFPGHGQSGSPITLLDEQLNYIGTFRSLVEQELQQLQPTGEVGINITEEGKTRIKSELERLYPKYLHVASIPLSTMLDLNIDAIAKELTKEVASHDRTSTNPQNYRYTGYKYSQITDIEKFENTSDSHVRVIAIFTAKKDQGSKLENILVNLLEPTKKEKGNIAYVLYRSLNNSDELMFDELWLNKEALDFHLKQPYIVTALEQIKPILNSTVQVGTYSEISR